MKMKEMVDRIIAGDDSDFTDLLQQELQNGAPVQEIGRLIRSENENAKGLGAYIAYEMIDPRPIYKDVATLLDHPIAQLRADAINTLVDCLTEYEAEILGKILLLLDDPNPFIHRQVICFIQLISRRTLNVAVNAAADAKPNSDFELLPKFVGKPKTNFKKITKLTIRKLVEHPNPILQRFGVALAVRPREIVDREFLEVANIVGQAECQNALKWTGERHLPIFASIGTIS